MAAAAANLVVRAGGRPCLRTSTFFKPISSLMALPPLPRSALAPLVLLTVLLVVLSYTGRSAPAPAPKLPSGHTGDDRSSPAYTKQVVALGDLHGSLATAKRVLRMAGVIGLADEWTLGTGTLVQSGDIVDRGTDTFALYRFFEELRVDAEAQGGAFTSLLGNHETMNALGDWRYVTKDDIATFGGSAARRAEMSPDGSIGRAWLANYSLTARIPLHSLESSTLETNTAALSVIHAGLPLTTPLSTLLPYPDRLNKLAKSFLYKALLEEAPPCPPGPWPGIPSSMTAEEAALWDGQGVWWWRGNALDDERKACDEARRMAELIGVRRLISGHTPNFEGMVSRCNGTILLIDTGISPAYGASSPRRKRGRLLRADSSLYSLVRWRVDSSVDQNDTLPSSPGWQAQGRPPQAPVVPARGRSAAGRVRCAGRRFLCRGQRRRRASRGRV